MKKFILGIGSILVMSLLFMSTNNVQAETILPDEDAPIISSEGQAYLDAPLINLTEDTVLDSLDNSPINSRGAIIYTWKVESKKADSGVTYGGWREGPSGKGKATLTANNSNTTNRSATATISGDYPIGKGKIGSSLGISIGESKSYGVSYSIQIPAGKRQQIIFSPVYKTTKVKQRMYAMGIKSDTVKTATVKTFSHWDYSYKTLK